MKRILLITLLLSGCQSTALQHSSPIVSEVIPPIAEAKKEIIKESPEQIKKKERVSFGEKINKLNEAGKGSIRVCEIKDYDSYINIYYSNELGKRLVFRVYDEYVVNSVSLYLDKNKTSQFIDFIHKSMHTAKENKDLETLHLGKFDIGRNWIMLSSHHGRVTGFWGGEEVDRVLTSIDYEKIIECSETVKPYL